jgi:hypothetical protein
VQVIPASPHTQPGGIEPTQPPQLDCATESLGQTKVPSSQIGSVTTSWLHPPTMQEDLSDPVQTLLLHPSKLPASANNPTTLNKLNMAEIVPPTGPNGGAAGWDPLV